MDKKAIKILLKQEITYVISTPTNIRNARNVYDASFMLGAHKPI